MPGNHDQQTMLQKILDELSHLTSGNKSDPKVPQELLDELNRPASISAMPRRIELCRQALAIISKEAKPEQWGKFQDDLARSLAETPIGPQAENIEEAIAHFGQALEVRTRGTDPRRWAMTQNHLGTAYRERIYGKRAENIERAIACYQQALEVRTREAFPKEWAITQANLAGAYYKRIQGKRAENLERAIHLCHQGLKAYPRLDHPKFLHFCAQAKNTLGELYRVRTCGSHLKNVERSIYHLQQVLETHPEQGSFPEDWAMTQNNLGNAFVARIRGSRADNIEQAIHHLDQALKADTPQSNPEFWGMTQYNLGNAYRERIRGDQRENIEQAIRHLEEARKVHTQRTFPEGWARIQNSLGNTYLARTHGKQEKNIEHAILHFQQALKVYTEETFPEDWAQAQNNLGNAYRARVRGERADNLEKSIRCYQHALKVRTREAFPSEWAQTLSNLAGTERLRASETIEQAIQHIQQALEVYSFEAFPQDWAGAQNNLAIAYADRMEGERSDNIEQAIRHYHQALTVYTPGAFPDHCLKTSRSLGNLAFEEQRWKLAGEAYDTAFRAQEVLMQASFSRADKQVELGQVQNLPARAAFAHVRMGNLKRAVEVLEQGRAQLLRESLERRRGDLKRLDTLGFGRQYQNYKQAVEQYETLQNAGVPEGAHSRDWIAQMEQALERMQVATAAIREEVGQGHLEYRYFLKSLPFDEIQRQAEHKPVVYLSATSAGGLALVVSPQGIKSVKLPKHPRLNQSSLQKQIWRPSDKEIERINTNLREKMITNEDIQAVSGGYFSTYALWSLTPQLTRISYELKQGLFESWKETLDETAHWLWDVVMGKLVRVLKEYGTSATFIPAAQLALLPLHAAWTEDPSKPTSRRYALDELNISYAPSAHALWRASLAFERHVESIMAVDNPDGSLSFSEAEVKSVLSLFRSSSHLQGKNATLTAVKEEMQKAHLLHFSTHGRAGWEKAEEAWLKLADGYLTLPDILDLDLNQARLAVLSACETGMPGLELIDEMIGLPAGMMQAGVQGVVGSLWSVSDMSTAILMARFYHLWLEEGCHPREALCQAQIWLRDSTTRQKKELFESIMDEKTLGMSAEAAQVFYEHIQWKAPEERSFASPFYWAAFAYTGI